ncbi:RNA polymerase sigma factor [Lutibacter sp.]|uniref:RNA polymerase sigma factor n=1 Tax=Lutibacter sp. TaxID=1925666 RepID=UPI0035626395
MDFTNLCDEKQFDIFYKQQINNVFRFILIKSKDNNEALDIAQEAFIKIWENCNKFDLSKAKSYLFSIASNLFLNVKKHQKVVRNYENNSTELYIETETPEDTLRGKEFKTKLEKALNDLTDGQREVFLLNRVEGKKYREIAEMLNISVKAVEKRMSQALVTLRSKIEELK